MVHRYKSTASWGECLRASANRFCLATSHHAILRDAAQSSHGRFPCCVLSLHGRESEKSSAQSPAYAEATCDRETV
jgi:hypothetical protein